MLDTIRDLFAHMEWADAAVWQAAIGHDDERLTALLLHLHMTQRAFFTVWSAADFEYETLATPRKGRELIDWAREYYTELTRFVEAVDEAALSRPSEMPWARRFFEDPGVVTLQEAMLQVAMHSTYHRGQVNARLRELGAEPPLVDYIAWLWKRRPAPDWP